MTPSPPPPPVWKRIAGNEVVHDQEPGAGFWRQLEISVLSLLPS